MPIRKLGLMTKTRRCYASNKYTNKDEVADVLFNFYTRHDEVLSGMSSYDYSSTPDLKGLHFVYFTFKRKNMQDNIETLTKELQDIGFKRIDDDFREVSKIKSLFS